MNGILNENVFVKEYEIHKPLIQKIDFIFDNCIRDCHSKCFHTFDHKCVFDINFTNNANNETVKSKISDKNMSLYGLKKN